MNYVCIDVDGTLMDFSANLSTYLKKTQNISFNAAECTDYNYRHESLGFDRNIIYECFKEPELYESLKFFTGAVPALKKLQAHIQTRAYTGAVDVPEIVKRRSEVCREIGLIGGPIVGGRKPTDMQAVALFDDCLGVHKQWIADGSKAKLFLIDAPYNRVTPENKDSVDWSRITRCSSFEDAVERFLKGD